MDPSTTILRVKRKRGTDPADALLLACKRIRPEATAAQPSDESEPEPQEPKIENSVFKLVATVVSQDAPVQPHVREALARPRLAHHALRPSQGSAQRIIGDLRSVKWSTRREERYRILSSHRAGLPTEPAPARGGEESKDSQTESGDSLSLGEVQVFDIVHEEEDVKMPGKMIREKLSVSGDGLGTEHREKEDDYVPDEVAWEEEVYEDEDDENAETNWRNDYPDESSEGDSDAEERFGEDDKDEDEDEEEREYNDSD
ncbi:putative RNA polymerase II nuclear localization protein SLC7A6OS [Labeo rohita]|uniref:RNA polymerase II nuclear localization protein SLC7A6OS n=1 Tax=Labeo rohita TaxID=84645 RepID=A0ABQ8MKJ3_LABRO|nr:putative RNA polymerase II nuclear localization protein SLC7A6OS [Labeo rohita]